LFFLTAFAHLFVPKQSPEGDEKNTKS